MPVCIPSVGDEVQGAWRLLFPGPSPAPQGGAPESLTEKGCWGKHRLPRGSCRNGHRGAPCSHRRHRLSPCREGTEYILISADLRLPDRQQGSRGGDTAQDRGAPPALAGMEIKHLWAQRGQAWMCKGNKSRTAPASSEPPAQVRAGVSHQERQAFQGQRSPGLRTLCLLPEGQGPLARLLGH